MHYSVLYQIQCELGLRGKQMVCPDNGTTLIPLLCLLVLPPGLTRLIPHATSSAATVIFVLDWCMGTAVNCRGLEPTVWRERSSGKKGSLMPVTWEGGGVAA